MADFTPATVDHSLGAGQETDTPAPFVSKLSPAEGELLLIAERVSAALRYLAAQIPSALPLAGMAADIDAAVARARDIDRK